MPKTLEQVIIEWRELAAAAKRLHDERTADVILTILHDVSDAAEDYLRFFSEADAQLRSGKSARWLRSQFPEWMAQGNARRNARGERQYRALVIPQRGNTSAAYEAGLRGDDGRWKGRDRQLR